MGKIQNSHEEVSKFKTNLIKDNQKNRINRDVINQKYHLLEEFENKQKLREDINRNLAILEESKVSEFRSYVKEMEVIFAESKIILNQRKAIIDSVGEGINRNSSNMSESFNLKTAVSLLPIINDAEDSICQLIDAIELYDSLLDASGKKLLTNYVLKTRLSPSAKLRLNKTYANNESLIADIKRHLIPKKSASALAIQLNNSKQGDKSVEDFGKHIENLLVNLTVAQADGNDAVAAILKETNEKIAVNVFANGLRDNNLKLIVKARNYPKLSEAINGAKEEESIIPVPGSSQMYHFRGKNNFRGGSYSNRGNFRGNRGYYSGSQRGRTFSNHNLFNRDNNQNNNGSNRGNNHSNDRQQQNYRGNNYRQNTRNNHHPGYHNNGNNNQGHRTFFINENENENADQSNSTDWDINDSVQEPLTAFFRGPTEPRNE